MFLILWPLLGFTLLFIFMEGRDLARKKQWKDLGIASFIMLIAWLYGVDLGWDLQLMPNPLDFFQLFNGIDKWYYNFFHLSA